MKKGILLLYLLLFTIYVSAQTITTFAGNGTVSGSIGDGGPATSGILNGANGGAFDKYGNYYVTEIQGHRVRKVTPSGIISTIAGTGTGGYNGDGVLATAAKLNEPTAVALDTNCNVYIADLNNFRIRKVDAATGLISTVAGTGTAGYNSDGIAATTAQLAGPQDVCLDRYGNIYIADQPNYRIRKVNTSGIISTIAGNGGFSSTGTGDGGPATNATFNFIFGIAMDDSDNLFIADYNGAKVRKVDLSGNISTVAGNGSFTYSGDGVIAITAQIAPCRLTFDDSARLTIADKYNRRILRINHDNIIHCIAGNGGPGYTGDNVPATTTSLDYPAGVVFDACGNLYIAESSNRRVRKVWFAGMAATPVVTITSASSDTVCAGTTVVLNSAVSGADSTLTYKWYVNGVAVSAATNASYSYTPTNGDTVNCKVQAFVACNGAFTVSSNTIHLTTIAGGSPTISLAGVSAAAIGATVTLTASISGAGSSYTIHWMNHNTQFAATTVPTVSYIKGSGTDTITARIVPNGSCYDSTTSAIHIVTQDRTGVGCIHNSNIIIYPNPMGDILHIDNAEAYNSYIIYDITGRKLMSDSLAPYHNSINTSSLEKGIYLLELQSATAPPQVIRVSK